MIRITFTHVGDTRLDLADLAAAQLVRGEPGDVLALELDQPEVGSSKPPIIRSVVVCPQQKDPGG